LVNFMGDDMKKLFVSIASLALLTGSALAADLAPAPAPAYRAPVPVPPALSWTGCNINAGYGYGLWNQEVFEETDPGHAPTTTSITFGGRGWLGRFGAGCDYQFGLNGFGNWVVGVFGDYDIMDVHGNFEPAIAGLVGEEKESGAWSAGGRIGYLVTPSLLTYFDGGYTQTRFDQINLVNAVTLVPSNTILANTYHGWFLGGGTEYALNFSWLPIQGLFWRNEYRYSSYQSADLSMLTLGGGLTGVAVNVKPYVQTITSSLVWRFGL
jgi:outer membrane immunogenic protein